ncbi:MAG: hypothetical protein R3277_07805 [Brumimicrobium sp.]|nr:hypothetical protein [Brumimicrobium sp.]
MRNVKISFSRVGKCRGIKLSGCNGVQFAPEKKRIIFSRLVLSNVMAVKRRSVEKIFTEISKIKLMPTMYSNIRTERNKKNTLVFRNNIPVAIITSVIPRNKEYVGVDPIRDQ